MTHSKITDNKALATLASGFLAVCIFCSSSAYALGPLTGELGIDLENYSWSGVTVVPFKSLLDPGGVFAGATNRTMSNHYLRLGLSGPVVNSNFANYALRSTLSGTYFRTKADLENANLYLKPGIRSYSGQLTMFPNRRYPLKLHHSKTRDYSLRYEPANRGDIELILPQLAVVRRYEADLKATGAQMRYAVSDKMNLTTEYKKDSRETLRNYDFDENRNLWVSFVTVSPNPLQDSSDIQITNTLEDADLIVVLDTMIVDTVRALSDLLLIVSTGSHQVDLIPTRFYNQYSFNIVVQGDMSWKVIFSDPATPNDQSQSSDAFSANLEYDDNNKTSNRLFFERTKQLESFQNLRTEMTILSNAMKYKFNRRMRVNLLSTYNTAETDLIGTSSQQNSALANTTNFSALVKKDIATNFSHSYNRNKSQTTVGLSETDVTSVLNTFDGRARIPNKRFKNVLTLKADYARLRDSKDYGTDQRGLNVINEFDLKFRGIRLKPRQYLKYTVSTVHEPDTDSSGATISVTSKTNKEMEPKFALTGEAPPSKLLGDLRFKLEYNYRNRFDDFGSSTTSRYYADLTLVRKFGKTLRLLLSTTRELESYGGSLEDASGGATQVSKPSEKQSTYRIDAQMNPSTELSIGTGLMLISQDGNSITKYSLMIGATIPKLNIPIRSFINSETRSIVGLPKQVTTNAETKFSYRLRQITLIFMHTYTKEELIGQTFSLHEAKAQIKRNFSMF